MLQCNNALNLLQHLPVIFYLFRVNKYPPDSPGKGLPSSWFLDGAPSNPDACVSVGGTGLLLLQASCLKSCPMLPWGLAVAISDYVNNSLIILSYLNFSTVFFNDSSVHYDFDGCSSKTQIYMRIFVCVGI